MIKLYSLQRIFHFKFSLARGYLRNHGIVYVSNPFKADVIVSSGNTRKYNLARKLFFFKKFITWTNEPRQSTVYDNFNSGNEVVMNVYSGNVFFHNLHFLGSYYNVFNHGLGINLQAPPGESLTLKRLSEKQKFCIAVFGYRDPASTKLIIHNSNADLYARRQELASFLYQRHKADIVGSHWPASIQVIERSGYEARNKEWWTRKMDILRDYKFNLCFENTIYPYYCTEKLWHAIAAGCLPIYYGEGTAIYETFPANSFVDASRFKTNEALLEFLEQLTPEEHINRYNLCLEVMHRSCAKRLADPNLKPTQSSHLLKPSRNW